MTGLFHKQAWFVVLGIAFALPISSLNADGCPYSSPAEATAEVAAPLPGGSIDWIVPDSLVGDAIRHTVVDVRSASARRTSRLPSVLEVDLLQLRGMIGRTDEKFAVIGFGYDGRQLARRIGSWAEVSGQVHIVRGGAPAWMLSQTEIVGDATLEKALGVPASLVPRLVEKQEWRLLLLDETSISIAEEMLPQSISRLVVDVNSLKALADQLRNAGLTDAQHFLVMDKDGGQSTTAALELSQMLRRSVFYVQGGAAAVSSEARRFADINRQPRGMTRGCQ